MSFVEGLSAVSLDVTDPAFAICATAMVVLLVGLFALPAIAAALSFLRTEGLMRFLSHLFHRKLH